MKKNGLFIFLSIILLSIFGFICYDSYDMKTNPDRKEEYEKYLLEQENLKKELLNRKPLTYTIKDMEVYIKELTIQRNSNVFKKDLYYITTNGNNCDEIIYIEEELFYTLKDILKEPGIVTLSCDVRNGYLDGINYEDYIVDIYN